MITSNRVSAIDVRAKVHKLQHHGFVPAACRQVKGGPPLCILGRYLSAQLDQALSHTDQAGFCLLRCCSTAGPQCA